MPLDGVAAYNLRGVILAEGTAQVRMARIKLTIDNCHGDTLPLKPARTA